MRIIAGNLGGRQFESPHGHRTHPMAEKVRGGLFNALGDIEGLTVLDAFAGSGALSFEAMSRGAASSVAVDIDKGANTTIVKNIRDLGLKTRVKAIRASISGWLETDQSSTFDLIFADPPYDAVQENVLAKLADRLNPGGVIVYSLPPTSTFRLPATSHQNLATKTYGDATLHFYRENARV